MGKMSNEMRLSLNEDLFDDIVEIELPNSEEQIEIPTAPEINSIPTGPVTGEELGQSSMLLDAISSCAKTIDNYNVIKANLTDPKMIEVMGGIASQETNILGQLQGLLQQVSPNASEIMYGATDVDSALTESFEEDKELTNTLYDFIGDLVEKYGVKAVVRAIKSIFPNLDWSLGESLNEAVDNDYETYAEAVIDSIVNHYKDSEDLPDILRSFGRLVNLLARQSADKHELDIEYPTNESLEERGTEMKFKSWIDDVNETEPEREQRFIEEEVNKVMNNILTSYRKSTRTGEDVELNEENLIEPALRSACHKHRYNYDKAKEWILNRRNK